MMIEIDRRAFLAGASVAALAGWPRIIAADDQPAEVKTLPVTTLGRTGRVVSRLGIGVYPIIHYESHDDAVAVLRHAFDLGVRYIDTAPSYGNGRSETRIGLALQGYERSEFFIATKTLERSGDAARRELEQSLARLGLDSVDSVQIHSLKNDIDSLFGPDAVLKALEKAREEKLVKHIGITAHFNPKYLIEAVKHYPFATVLVPINPLDTKYLSFTREFLPVAKAHDVAVVAMKVYAGGVLLEDGKLTPAECVHYALSQAGVDVIIPGCETIAHVDDAYNAAMAFKPLSREAQADIEQRAGEHKGKESEWYKDRDSDG
ncbi:MAG: aldo/keto reductase [Phycisphaerales bacterium]|nr:aldo/keto reductase [Phycisphaerales bacterium]